MRILLVEDDTLLGEGIAHGLKQDNFVAEWVKDGVSAEAMLKQEKFDAAILDLGLPRKDGLSVLKSVRKRGIDTPILILTAKNTSYDLISAMNSGADDFLAKPFEFNVLTARLNALIRRSNGKPNPTIKLGPFELDSSSNIATKDGKLLKLSKREYKILQIMLNHIGKIVTKTSLINSLYTIDDDLDSNSLEVHIHNLRKKLGVELLKTVRGVGYLVIDLNKTLEKA
jgi:two-component system, OmpR family, response regulator QseB